jgi:hypothetical protein
LGNALTREDGGPPGCSALVVRHREPSGEPYGRGAAFGWQGNRPLSTCRGALLHSFRRWAWQVAVTDCDEQSVARRLLCAHNAE